jgi:hypothetical protein
LPTPFPLVPTHGKDLFFPPALHFKNMKNLKSKCTLMVQGHFTLVLPICMYHAFIPSITYSFSSTMLPSYSTVYWAVHYFIFIYRWFFQYLFYSLTFSFSLLPPIALSHRFTNTVLFCHQNNIYIFIFIFIIYIIIYIYNIYNIIYI